MSRSRIEACVVGSGAGGAMVALGLARAGVKVLVLERGPHVERAAFRGDERDVLGRRFRPSLPADPHTYRLRAGERARVSEAGWTAACVGGGTVLYGGVSLRLRPGDLRLRSELGPLEGAELADWPIAYQELEPYYSQAEALLGVSGDVRANPFEPPRAGPLPLPPVSDKAIGPLLDEGAARLGWHPYRVPLAVLSRPRDGRPACTGCGLCARDGCPIGAKSSAPEAILPLALATGRCRIEAEAQVHQIVVDARGRARSVRYLDRQGRGHQVEAEVVVLACGAVESARLLLSSRAAAGGTLANGSGLVGKHLTFHMVPEIGGYFDRPVWSRRGAPSVRAFDDLYRLPSEAGAPLGGVVLLGDGLGPLEFALQRTPWGAGHGEAMRRYPHHGRLFVIGQDLPRRINDVTLDPEVKDRRGLAVARITHENHPLDRRAARFAAERVRALLEAAGAREVYQLVPEDTEGDAHQHGTCRFGRDPRTSVLDPDCAAHEVPNLFVADGSFMPTSGGVNPALTIQANALRVAARIVERGRRQEL